MVRVKICGITSRQDALHAARCGADALGFVFYPGSPRYVSPEQARGIIEELPPFVTTVGLFVNESPGDIRRIAEGCGLDVLQLHGDESPAACEIPPFRVMKAFRVKDERSLDGLPDYRVSAFLLDAWVAGSYGGTGQSFNWDLAARIARDVPVVLAGGLDPDNVAQAVGAVRPYGVDVSSGVELAAGRKDPDKVAAFIRNAKKMVEL